MHYNLPIARPSHPAVLSAIAAASLCACGEPPAPGSAGSLLAALQQARPLHAWQLDAHQFAAILRPEYRPLHDAYTAAFAIAAPAVFAQLAHARAITVRRHYAGDPLLTPAEARDRWALPTLAASWVVELDGAPLDGRGAPSAGSAAEWQRGVVDAVFVADGAQWHTLLGLDAALQHHVAALDAACAARLAQAGPPGRCTEVGALIASAALRNQHAELEHACQLAQALCGTESP